MTDRIFAKLGSNYHCAGRGCKTPRIRSGHYAMMLDNGNSGVFCIECATEGEPDVLDVLERYDTTSAKELEGEAEQALEAMERVVENGRHWLHFQRHSLRWSPENIRIPRPVSEADQAAKDRVESEQSKPKRTKSDASKAA